MTNKPVYITDEAQLLHDIRELLREERQPRQSILDGTVSCRLCRALVLEENAAGHGAWHDE